jgi:hypothetical protein
MTAGQEKRLLGRRRPVPDDKEITISIAPDDGPWYQSLRKGGWKFKTE